MKKYLPILFLLQLAACSSQLSPQDPNVLQPGIMQAVEGTGAVEGGSWLPEIQKQSLPASMQQKH